MSRIGRVPVYFDDKIQVTTTSANEVVVKGGKHTLAVKMQPSITARIEGKKIVLLRSSEVKEVKSLHGMYRALIQSAVDGVTRGFAKTLELHGVGYRAAVVNKKLELSLGFSHPINFSIPDGIEVKVDKQVVIVVSGPSAALVGQVAAKIRSFRPPEPYLGKGVRYQGERIRKKAGKSASK